MPELLPPTPIHLSTKTSTGERLNITQQVYLVDCIRGLNYDVVRSHLIAEKMIPPNADANLVFGIMHNARLAIITATDAEKNESETWLRQRGMM